MVVNTIEKTDKFSGLLTKISGNNFEITLPTYLRDEVWAKKMGEIQEQLEHFAQGGHKGKKLAINFISCHWIDPLPLMSMLIETINVIEMGINVNIMLPMPDKGPNPYEIGPYQKSPNRLLLFLNQEGFFDCLDKYKSHVSYSIARSEFQNMSVLASYEDAKCIPLQYFIVPHEKEVDFANKTVENLIRGVDSRLDSKVSPFARERLVYKLRLALQELLHNVQEHAYEGGVTRLIAIYVRYRTGGFGLGSKGLEVFDKHLKQENTHCPMIKNEWLLVKSGCLEVFVLDRGIGMVDSFKKTGVQFKATYPFEELMKDVFLDGRSRRLHTERNTRFGGLHLLYKMLSQTGDFIRALEKNEWFSSNVPIDRITNTVRKLTNNTRDLSGLAIHLRLCWKSETDEGIKWEKFEVEDESKIWKEFSLNEKDCQESFKWFEQHKVIDDRFGSLKEYGNKDDWTLWLVRPHLMKWDILNFIEKRIAPKVSKKTLLIIADIPSYEAETYRAALDDYKSRTPAENWPTKFSWIILATNRWRFAAVEYCAKEKGKHGFSKLHENVKKIRIATPPIKPRPDNFRLGIVRWLKWHDSRRLWEEVSKSEQMFIPQQISWGVDKEGKERSVAGYLDFPQTTRNVLCSAIYQSSLARIFGISPPHSTELLPIDRFTMTVLEDIHAEEVYEHRKYDSPKTRIAIGSVLVSGSTLKATTVQPLDMHFFIHSSNSLIEKKPSLLFWLPNNHNQIFPESKLARIGKTAFIGLEGSKSFEIPRFDTNQKPIGVRDPASTYRDWQNANPVITKIGHWLYEGQHDILTVNIPSAVESAFCEMNDLAGFLINQILPFCGLGKKEVEGPWRNLMKSSSQGGNDSGILVYRSHPSTEVIVRRLLGILTPTGRKRAEERIFPILPIRMRWHGSSFLIPPLVRENIREALKKFGSVLLFDDATITGRTLHDLQITMEAIGAKSVKTTVIANRLRQPAEGNANQRIKYFWRLDLPVMGREGNCPLCQGLNIAEELSYSFISNPAKEEIAKWKLNWSAISPLDNWNRGLRSIPLSKPEIGKKFSYRQTMVTDSEEKKFITRIDITRTTGLAIYIAELHAMTSRDDYGIEKINQHNQPEITIELAASQLLLFGDEFDVDILIELLKSLILALPKLGKKAVHAPLAVLSILAGFRLLGDEAKRMVAKTVDASDYPLNSNNETKILLAYFVHEQLIEAGTMAYKLGERLLTTSSLSLPQRFNAFFRETNSSSGNAHSGAIPILINKLDIGDPIDAEYISDAQESLDRLNNILENIDPLLASGGAYGGYRAKAQEMKQSINDASKILSKQLSSPVNTVNWQHEAKTVFTKLVETMKSVADCFFHRFQPSHGYSKNPTFEVVALDSVIKKIDWQKACENKKCYGKTVEIGPRDIEISVDGKLDLGTYSGEVWIAWHLGVVDAVQDLLRNAVYAGKKIVDPWSRSPKNEAHLWVKVDYLKTFVKLTMVNDSASDSSGVFKVMQDNKHRWASLEEVGGSVGPSQVGNGLVGIEVRLPYAGKMQKGIVS